MLPNEFSSRMEALLGPDYPAFLAAYDRPLQKGLRLGRKARSQALTLPFELEPVVWAAAGFSYKPDVRPGKHPYHEAGVYYLQEPSAMAPAALLHPQPGDRVLDLCAAPGGKSTQLADALDGSGLLVANEIHPKRAKILARNIERMGIANALVLNMHPRDLELLFAGFFDKIMVDAPCSGEGMFRKEDAAAADWSPETVAMCAHRQREILQSAAKLLRPGGVLCYSTCTFAPEEDEGVIAWFLTRHPEFSPMAADAPWFDSARPEWADPYVPEITKGFRLWPHKLGGEGHFSILLKKSGSDHTASLSGPKPIATPPELLAFLDALNITLPAGTLAVLGSALYLLPPGCPDLKGLKVLRPGLELGTLRKNRFEPAHALALWLSSAAQTANYSADDPALLDYLHGQVLSGTQQGWTLVTVDNFSLGWAKGSGGQLKNHFPKGLRWM